MSKLSNQLIDDLIAYTALCDKAGFEYNFTIDSNSSARTLAVLRIEMNNVDGHTKEGQCMYIYFKTINYARPKPFKSTIDYAPDRTYVTYDTITEYQMGLTRDKLSLTNFFKKAYDEFGKGVPQ